MHILEGEGLLNDASGVTAFQFALGALITGSFSAVNAGMSLVVSSIGGALIGFFACLVQTKIIHLIEKASAQDVTGYLLIELLLPFLAYVLAEAFDVSGIIAAVAAGILKLLVLGESPCLMQSYRVCPTVHGQLLLLH